MRYYWYVPFDAISLWWHNRKDPYMDFRLCWGTAVGTSQIKMKWYFTEEEVFGDDWREKGIDWEKLENDE